MNLSPNNSMGKGYEAESYEDTLHLLANLPAPEGLEDRVMAGLRAAPRRGRVLHWPVALQPAGGWMRAAAAAAIVAAVAGGGWGIYSHVQPAEPFRVTGTPPRVGAGGGFSNAGAMRVPQTVNGPVVSVPIVLQSVQAKPVKKLQGRSNAKPAGHPQKPVIDQAAAPPAAPVEK